jgi:multisubunit Na+/H+ antiporter MnhB subunit
MTQTVARALLAPTWMVAAATLVKGYADTGDGFSAGVIASLGILLQYVAFGHEEVERRLPVHLAPMIAVAGLFLALAVAFTPLLVGEAPMKYWPPPGEDPIHLGSLEIIGAVAFDLGVFMIVLGVCVGAVDLIAHAQRTYRRRSR